MSIADREVFAFQMIQHTDATEGDAYFDMSQVDTTVTLTVGCIQVVFLNKFLSSILVRIARIPAIITCCVGSISQVLTAPADK